MNVLLPNKESSTDVHPTRTIHRQVSSEDSEIITQAALVFDLGCWDAIGNAFKLCFLFALLTFSLRVLWYLSKGKYRY